MLLTTVNNFITELNERSLIYHTDNKKTKPTHEKVQITQTVNFNTSGDSQRVPKC